MEPLPEIEIEVTQEMIEKTLDAVDMMTESDDCPLAITLAAAYREMKKKWHEEISKGRERAEGIVEIAVKESEARIWKEAAEIYQEYDIHDPGYIPPCDVFREREKAALKGLEIFKCKIGPEG